MCAIRANTCKIDKYMQMQFKIHVNNFSCQVIHTAATCCIQIQIVAFEIKNGALFRQSLILLYLIDNFDCPGMQTFYILIIE